METVTQTVHTLSLSQVVDNEWHNIRSAAERDVEKQTSTNAAVIGPYTNDLVECILITLQLAQQFNIIFGFFQLKHKHSL